MLRFVLAFLVVAFTAPIAAAQTGDETAIRATVMEYFTGQGEHNRDKLRRAFAREYASQVIMLNNTRAPDSLRMNPDMDDVIREWVDNPNPPTPNRDGEILEIHILDGRMASVFFRNEDRYFEMLSLLKIDDEWKIVHRAYMLQHVPGGPAQ